MSRTLVLGDIHGEAKKLRQVFERCKLSKEDLVISLGDIVDRGEDPFKCMQILHDLPHRVLVKGNHDASFHEWLKTGYDWLGGQHGSRITQNLYNGAPANLKEFVKRFLHEQVTYYVDRHNYCYVHGGFYLKDPMSEQSADMLMWDRTLWNHALANKHIAGDTKLKNREHFGKIFIGHTPTTIWDSKEPMYASGVWNIDTGSGKGGRLTIMDVETEEFWQSD